MQIFGLAQETLILLMEFNQDIPGILDWIIERCYESNSVEVSELCFECLTTVFSSREYPCFHIAVLNVALLNLGSAKIRIREMALQLFHLLYKRFYEEEVANSNYYKEEIKKNYEESLFVGPFSQMNASQTLAYLLPDLTLSIFSEITQRVPKARSSVRRSLLQYVLPWLHNLELVDPNLPDPINLNDDKQDSEFERSFLKGEGWGSPEATQLVLNNLFHITAEFGDRYPHEMEDLWAALVRYWPGNLRVIVRYIIILMGMAPVRLLTHVSPLSLIPNSFI